MMQRLREIHIYYEVGPEEIRLANRHRLWLQNKRSENVARIAVSSEIGLRLRQLRIEAGLMQKQVGWLIDDVSDWRVSRIECGDHLPSEESTARLAFVFSVSHDLLRFGIGMP